MSVIANKNVVNNIRTEKLSGATNKAMGIDDNTRNGNKWEKTPIPLKSMRNTQKRHLRISREKHCQFPFPIFHTWKWHSTDENIYLPTFWYIANVNEKRKPVVASMNIFHKSHSVPKNSRFTFRIRFIYYLFVFRRENIWRSFVAWIIPTSVLA